MTEISDVVVPKLAEGVHAGALEAIRRARSTGTKLVIWRNGQVVEISAEEAEAMLKIEEGK